MKSLLTEYKEKLAAFELETEKADKARTKKPTTKEKIAAFWNGYDYLNAAMADWLQYSTEKLLEMKLYDELDLDMRFSVLHGDISISEFYEQYNQDVKEIFAPADQKLKDSLYKPMSRLVGKPLTDQEKILIRLLEEVTIKAGQAIKIHRSVEQMTASLKKQYAEIKKLNDSVKQKPKATKKRKA